MISKIELNMHNIILVNGLVLILLKFQQHFQQDQIHSKKIKKKILYGEKLKNLDKRNKNSKEPLNILKLILEIKDILLHLQLVIGNLQNMENVFYYLIPIHF